MKVVVLNYFATCIEVFNIPEDYFKSDSPKDISEQVEEYLYDKNLKPTEISWMACDEDVPVYYENDSTPKIRL